MSQKIKPINRQRMKHNYPHIWDVTDLCEVIASHGDKVVYRYFEGKELRSMTYGEFAEMIHKTAAAFNAMGLSGKKVAVIGDTSPQWVATYIGAMASGCVVVPMDKELAVDEIDKFFKLVDVRAVVYSKGFNESFIKLISDEANEVEYFIPVTPAYDNSFNSKVMSFDEVIACGEDRIARDGYAYPMVSNRSDLAELLFTSGTTGTSKCVMLSQTNVFSVVNSAAATVCFTKDDVLVSVLPVHHTYELACMMAALVIGIEICINDSLRHIMKNFQLFKPTGLVLVPLFLNTMYKKIWTEAERTHKDVVLKGALKTSKAALKVGIDMRKKLFKSVIDAFGGRLDHIICGGARLNPELIDGFEQFGISVFEGFGITECAPLTNVTPYYARKYGSVGPAVPCCRVRISEEFGDGQNNEHGYNEGEIQVKGDNVMIGYYNNPEANAAAFTEDGWFRTGDIGYMDEDGYVYITGRLKSVIVLENGKNVFPEEIEEYLDEIESVAECVVVGRKAEGSDEVLLTAVVYPDKEKFPVGTSDELIHESVRNSINQLNRKLPSFKQIRNVELRRTEFEKTTSKKIKRHLVK